MAENFSNDFSTTLASAITGTEDVTITIASSTGAPAASFRIRIDDELMLVTAVAHPTWTVTRHVEGTAGATHSNGAAAAHVLTKGGLDTYLRESGQLLAAEIALGDTLTVPVGHQLLVGNGYTVGGTLVLDGDLVMVG